MSLAGLKYYLSDPKRLFDFAASRGLLNGMSDEKFIKLQYRLITGKKLNLDNPESLNEKLQYLKLYQHDAIQTLMVDKYSAKEIVAEKIGAEHIIPLVGGPWDSADEIDFDALPESFVLKCTHDSGGLIICKDKASLDIEAAKAKLSKCLRRNFYYMNREWPYKNIHPRIIAERYLESADGKEPVDYKFYFYGGELQYFMYSLGEAEHNVRNHKFDRNLRSIDHLFKAVPTVREEDIELPENIDEMIQIAEKLGNGYRHIRIDLYNIDGKIYFGEYTFFSGGGYINIDSHDYANYLADKIHLTRDNI